MKTKNECIKFGGLKKIYVLFLFQLSPMMDVADENVSRLNRTTN